MHEPAPGRVGTRTTRCSWGEAPATDPDCMEPHPVPRVPYAGHSWGPARRWWGPGLDRRPLEVDVVAESADGKALLVGEAKWSEGTDVRAVLAALEEKCKRLPFAQGRQVIASLWVKKTRGNRGESVFDASDVMAGLATD